MSEQNEKDLKKTQQLFDLLRGIVPDGCTIAPDHVPKLTDDQAWTVIWWLGNQYWQVTDHVERCDECGDLYNGWNAGECMDYGDAPYNFCDHCMTGDNARAKRRCDPDSENIGGQT